MKVLLVTHEDPGRLQGGLGRFIAEYAQELKKWAEVRVLFLNLEGPEVRAVSPLIDFQVNVGFRFPADHPEGHTLDSAFFTRRALQPILDEFQPDVIHCNDRQTYLPFRDLPNVIFSLHLSYPDLLGPGQWNEALFQEYKIERYALQNAGATVVYSQFMAQRAQSLAPGCRPVVLPLGFNLQRIPQKKIQKPGQPLVVSFFGRFEQNQKGILDYIAGVQALEPGFIREYGLEFRIYGRGNPQHLGDLSRFSRVGFADQEDYYKALAETDIVVMPSKYEPFGLVGLEAVGANCWLLAPRGQGMDEYFIPEQNGSVIESAPGSIARVLEKVIRQWDYYRDKRLRGRWTVASWTWEKSVKAHLEVYRQVCGETPWAISV